MRRALLSAQRLAARCSNIIDRLSLSALTVPRRGERSARLISRRSLYIPNFWKTNLIAAIFYFRLTPTLIMGLVDSNVTELRIHDVDETTPLVDFGKYTPHLKSLEFSTR